MQESIYNTVGGLIIDPSFVIYFIIFVYNMNYDMLIMLLIIMLFFFCRENFSANSDIY